MELPLNYAAKFAIAKSRRTPTQLLADEIYDWAGKEVKYGRILGMIKLNGMQCVRECWIEAQKSKAKNSLALFLYLVRQNKTQWI